MGLELRGIVGQKRMKHSWFSLFMWIVWNKQKEEKNNTCLILTQRHYGDDCDKETGGHLAKRCYFEEYTVLNL